MLPIPAFVSGSTNEKKGHESVFMRLLLFHLVSSYFFVVF